MGRRNASRILISSAFLVLVMIGVDVMAQTAVHPSTTGTTQQTQPSKGAQNHNPVESNPACQRIIAECKKLGFIQGQWKKDNGLWKDCFDPVVKGGGTATRDGKPISVPVSSSDIQSCRAADSQHK
jgi:hypothetical protein